MVHPPGSAAATVDRNSRLHYWRVHMIQAGRLGYARQLKGAVPRDVCLSLLQAAIATAEQ